MQEYIHKEKQTIISEAFYKALKPAEKQNYKPYFGEDADDGTGAVTNDTDIDDLDEDDDLDFDMFNDDDKDEPDTEFGGGSGGGAGANGDW